MSRKATEAMVAMATIAIASSASRKGLKRQQYQVGSGLRAGLRDVLVRLMDFLLEGVQNTAVKAAIQVIFEALQGHADDVAVVEPGSDAGLRAKPQPDAMQAVDILWP